VPGLECGGAPLHVRGHFEADAPVQGRRSGAAAQSVPGRLQALEEGGHVGAESQPGFEWAEKPGCAAAARATAYAWQTAAALAMEPRWVTTDCRRETR
jgi:hypothetical protein